jgi:hypothetical protein
MKKLTLTELPFPLYDVPLHLRSTARAFYKRERGYLKAQRTGVPSYAIELIDRGAQDYRAVAADLRVEWEKFYNSKMGIRPVYIPEELLQDGNVSIQ